MNQNNILIAIGVVVVLGVAGYFIFGSGSLNTGPVAVVNGQEISRQDYNFIKNQIKERASLQGQELSEEDLEQQSLDQLVAQKLMYQEAKEKGFDVSQEEIDTQYQNVVSRAGGEEALQEVFSDLDLSEEYIREDIRKQLIIQKYVNSQTEGEDFSVTQQEVTDFYDQFSAGNENAPALKDIESQIRTGLEQQKQGELISEIVSQLRENAEIEILI